MRICAISDTHELHEPVVVPDGDILVSCGDETMVGNMNSFRSFIEWFAGQPHKIKVLVPGNHSWNFGNYNRGETIDLIKKAGIVLMEHDAAIIGGLKFFGSYYTPWY